MTIAEVFPDKISELFDLSIIDTLTSHWFPFPAITTPIFAILGVLLSIKVTSMIFKAVA